VLLMAHGTPYSFRMEDEMPGVPDVGGAGAAAVQPSRAPRKCVEERTTGGHSAGRRRPLTEPHQQPRGRPAFAPNGARRPRREIRGFSGSGWRNGTRFIKDAWLAELARGPGVTAGDRAIPLAPEVLTRKAVARNKKEITQRTRRGGKAAPPAGHAVRSGVFGVLTLSVLLNRPGLVRGRASRPAQPKARGV